MKTNKLAGILKSMLVALTVLLFATRVTAQTNSAIRIPDQEEQKTQMHYQFRFDDQLLGESKNITMSVWMNPRTAEGQLFGLVQSEFWGSNGTFWVKTTDGKITLGNRSIKSDNGFANQNDLVTEQMLALNEWSFITVTIDNDNKTRSLYCNGELLKTDEIANEGIGILPDKQLFFIGNGIIENGGNNNLTVDAAMDIDEVQVWTKALNAEEVKASMETVDPNAEGLTYLYRFTEANEDNTYNNLAKEDVKASLVYGKAEYIPEKWATIYSPSTIKAENVAGHSEEQTSEDNWKEIALITMSGNNEKDVDTTAVKFNGDWKIMNSGASAEYGTNFNKVYGPYLAKTNTDDYLAVKYNVPENGTYKFSFLSKRKSSLNEGMKLCYGKDLENLTDASNAMEIPKAAGNEAGKNTESNSIELEAGEYYFVYYILKSTDKVRVADFRLFQSKNTAVEPVNYKVTWNKPENGTIIVKNGEDTLTSPATVKENTIITIEATPAEGYKLIDVKANENSILETMNFKVTEETVITAVFELADTPAAEYTEPEYLYDNDNKFDSEKMADTYIENITLKNGEQIKTWNYQAPRVFWNVLSDMTMKANPGETVSAHFKAHSLGEYNTSKVLQDLRFTVVVLAIDWNGDGEFEYAEKIKGKIPPIDNIGGNADPNDIENYVMDYTYDIKVPADVKPGIARVRFNYTNAWFKENETAKDFINICKEGIVYDFDIEVGKAQLFPLNITKDENVESVILKKDGEVFEAENALPGTELSVEATFKDGYRLKSITVNGTDITESKTFTVTGESNITVSSEEIPSYTVSLEENEAIKSISLKDESDNIIEFGAKVKEGTKLFVDIELNEDFVLKSLKANDIDITNEKSFTVNSETTISIEAKKIEYVTVSYKLIGNAGNAKIEITDENGQAVESPAKIVKGSNYLIAIYPTDNVKNIDVTLNSNTIELEYDSDSKAYFYNTVATEDHEYVIMLNDGTGINSTDSETIFYDSVNQILNTNGNTTSVYDMMGNIVIKSNDRTISLSALNNGIYTIVNGNNILKIRR